MGARDADRITSAMIRLDGESSDGVLSSGTVDDCVQQMRNTTKLIGAAFVIGLILGGLGGQLLRDPASELGQEARVLGSLVVALVYGSDEEVIGDGNEGGVDAPLSRSVDRGDGPDTDPLPPPHVSEVPKGLFPEGPVPNELVGPRSKSVVAVREVAEIRNGWAFLYWFSYSVMMQDTASARAYVRDPAIVNRFFLQVIEEDIWSGKYYPLAAHLVSFSSDSPEEGIEVKMRINFVGGNVISTEGVGVVANIRFEEERWWITSIETTR